MSKAEDDGAARARANQCGQEVAAVLAKHRCRIQPFLLPLEPVGQDGSRSLVEASYGILPLAPEPQAVPEPETNASVGAD